MMDSATNITFRGITFGQMSTSLPAEVIELRNYPKNLSFLNCRMIGAHGDNVEKCIVYSLNSGDSNCLFSNNYLINGCYGFYMDGTLSTASYSCTLEGNILNNMAVGGIYVTYHKYVNINANSIKLDTINDVLGIMAEYNSGKLMITRNKVNLLNSSGGIYMDHNAGTVSAPIDCSNNFVVVSNNYGIFSSYNGFVNIYDNNVNIPNTSYLSYALYLTPGNGKTRVANNNLINSSGGYALYLDDISYLAYSDHNNFYTTGSNLFSYKNSDYSSLSSFIVKTRLDSNSFNEYPKYNSSTDLHIGDSALANAGVPIPNLTTDIDGDKRNPKAPTIGADEIPTAGGIPLFYAPSVCLGYSTSFTDSSTFIGKDSIVKWKWRFGDGMTDSLRNSAHSYSKGGYYNAELIITNKSGLMDSAFKTITVDSTCKWIVQGTISTSNNKYLKSSKIYLCTYDANDTIVNVTDSVVTDSMGRYAFATHDSNVYLFAMPSLSSYPNEQPTWADSGLTFPNANIIALHPGAIIKNFNTIYGANSGGSGFIGGKIVYCALCKSAAPVAKLRIILADSTGRAQTYTYTDANGNFSFKNIAQSKYKIFVDRPHIDNWAAPQINISLSSLGNLAFTLYPTYLSLNVVTGIEALEAIDKFISLYPNPTNGMINFRFNENHLGGSITIIDIESRLLKSVPVSGTVQATQIDISNLAPGLYFLHYEDAGIVWIGKFVKE